MLGLGPPALDGVLDGLTSPVEDTTEEPDPDLEGSTFEPGVIESWEALRLGGLWAYEMRFEDGSGASLGELHYTFQATELLRLAERDKNTYDASSGEALATVSLGSVDIHLDRSETRFATEFYHEVGACHSVSGNFGLTTLAFAWDCAYRQLSIPPDLRIYVVPGFLSMAATSDRDWFCREVCSHIPLSPLDIEAGWEPLRDGCIDSHTLDRWVEDFPFLLG